jgi:hypothetical protein
MRPRAVWLLVACLGTGLAFAGLRPLGTRLGSQPASNPEAAR